MNTTRKKHVINEPIGSSLNAPAAARSAHAPMRRNDLHERMTMMKKSFLADESYIQDIK